MLCADDAQILDLRTMQTRLLSEIAGTTLPEHAGYLTASDGAELPDRDDGWALLLLLFAQFRWDLGWGFTLNGLGGIIGLHHRPEITRLSEPSDAAQVRFCTSETTSSTSASSTMATR